MSTATAEGPVIIKMGDARFREDSAECFALPVDVVRKAFKRVAFAADNSPGSRYALQHVMLEIDGYTMTTVATDGRCMARWVIELPIRLFEEKRHFLVPKDVAKALSTIGTSAKGTVKFTVYTNSACEIGIKAFWDLKNKVKSVEGTAAGRFPRWDDIFSREEAKSPLLVIHGNREAFEKIMPSEENRFEFSVDKDHVATRKNSCVHTKDVDGLLIKQCKDQPIVDIDLDIDMLWPFLKSIPKEKFYPFELRIISTDDPIQGWLEGQLNFIQMPCARSKK